MSLLPYLSIKTPHDCVLYVTFVSTEKIKKTQTLRKKVREFTKLESLFEPHWKVIASYIQLLHFFRYAWGLVFVQFNYWQFDLIYFLIHWLILASRRFCQQVWKEQLLPTKCTIYRVMLKCGIHFTCNYLYTFCMYFVYKLYT